MKTLKQTTILLFVFVMIQLSANAQPLPPDEPGGNPVPLGWTALLLFLSAIVIGIKQLNKNKK